MSFKVSKHSNTQCIIQSSGTQQITVYISLRSSNEEIVWTVDFYICREIMDKFICLYVFQEIHMQQAMHGDAIIIPWDAMA